MEELADFADSIGIAGAGFADTGARVHQTWQGLGPVYSAPEADQLFAATGPVMSVSASVGEDLGVAASALHTFAVEAADIQARLEALRGEAGALVDAYGAIQDESTTATLDERDAELSAAVAAEIAEWEAAQQRCATVLRALSGDLPLTSYGSLSTIIEGGDGTTVYPEAPLGPMREIYPVDDVPPPTSTGNPPVVLGPGGTVINVPAPPGPAVVDGPGSLVPPLMGGGVLFDRATAAQPPPGPAGGPPGPPVSARLPGAPTHTGRLLPIKNGPPNGILVKRAPDGAITNYVEYDGNGLALRRVDLTGRAHNGIPTPHTVEYDHNINPAGETFPRARDVRPASPDEVP